MKKNIRTIVFAAAVASTFTGCVSDDDFTLPPFDELAYSENFEEAVDGTVLNIEGWANIAQTGGKKWTEERFPLTDGNGYAEFSTFNSGDAVNVGWLVSPAINLDGTGKKFSFEAAQHHLDSPDNNLEILISTNFNGTDVAAATWAPLQATLPTQANDWYDFINSGQIDLSAYSGNVYIAFKVTGSGTNTTLDGAYQIDNVKLF
jgi:hypothetical protein